MLGFKSVDTPVDPSSKLGEITSYVSVGKCIY